MAPDLAVIDVRIRTMDPDRPFAEAVAIQDGVVVALGDTAEVRAACDATHDGACPATAGTSRPGSSTGTSTCSWAPRSRRGINFDRVATLADVRALLRAERERVGPGAWVTGFAFEYAALQGAEFHHDLIDEAAGAGPMLIHALDMHTAFANGEALRVAAVTGTRRVR